MNVQDLTGKTVAFLASGGLDSITVTHWLTSRGVDVITFTGDLGQPDEVNLDDIAKRMMAAGAKEAVIVPLREQMAEAGIGAVQAQAMYESRYWNTTPLGRYVTTAGILPYLVERGITVLSHGATGRGNDQVRFQLITNMLQPEIQVYAPWRDEYFLDQFRGREEMVEYCKEHNLILPKPKEALYSTDANLLGLTHEAGELEQLTTPANFVNPEMGVRAVDAPDTPETLTISFEKGRPVTINGESVSSAADLFESLNETGGRHAVGINLHLVENRFVGTKSRGVYEAPGMEVLGSAYAFMLELILDRRTKDFFDFCSAFIAKQLYQSYGLDMASQLAGDAVATIAEKVTGTITVELYKGNVHFVSVENVPHSLYFEENASMSAVGDFDHADSEGLLRVFGVGAKATAHSGQVSPSFLGRPI